MPVTSGRSRTKRKQVSLHKEEYELAKKMAAAKGTSLSQVIGDALRAVDTRHSSTDPLAHLVGSLEGAHPQGSENHDEVIYDTRVR